MLSYLRPTFAQGWLFSSDSKFWKPPQMKVNIQFSLYDECWWILLYVIRKWLFLFNINNLSCFLQALLHSVPFGKMIVLDLYAEVKPIWNMSTQFYGTPYIWYIVCLGFVLMLVSELNFTCFLWKSVKFQVHASQFWRQHWNVWCSWFNFFRTSWCSYQWKFNHGTTFKICFTFLFFWNIFNLMYTLVNGIYLFCLT